MDITPSTSVITELAILRRRKVYAILQSIDPAVLKALSSAQARANEHAVGVELATALRNWVMACRKGRLAVADAKRRLARLLNPVESDT